jgi:hypothetical protein
VHQPNGSESLVYACVVGSNEALGLEYENGVADVLAFRQAGDAHGETRERRPEKPPPDLGDHERPSRGVSRGSMLAVGDA